MSRLRRTRCRRFASDIVDGAFAEAACLPTEAELAERFEVSRDVAREGLRSPQECAIVTVKHGSGATVRTASDWAMVNPEVIAAVLSGDRGAQLGDDLGCRRLPEIEAAGLAAQRASARDLDALGDAEAAHAAMRDHLPAVERYPSEHAAGATGDATRPRRAG
jgi:GntR family transcriptional repressor for pyruvate dehydrogenase complex